MIFSCSVVSGLAAVANQVEATNDLTNSEETNYLGGGDTNESDFLGVGITDTGEEGLGGGEAEVLEGSRVAGSVDEGLEVGLEGGQVAKGHISTIITQDLEIGGGGQGQTYGGVIFWPRNTSLPSSRPTRE